MSVVQYSSLNKVACNPSRHKTLKQRRMNVDVTPGQIQKIPKGGDLTTFFLVINVFHRGSYESRVQSLLEGGDAMYWHSYNDVLSFCVYWECYICKRQLIRFGFLLHMGP